MSLHTGIDTVAIASFGTYSETYRARSGFAAYIATLFVSFGYLEYASSKLRVPHHMATIPMIPTMPTQKI